MKTPAAAALIATTLACLPAAAASWLDGEEGSEWQRNGRLSRYLWEPGFASGQAGGVAVSAGVAVGLRGPVHANVGRRVAPALTLQWDRRASVSVLPAGGGAMFVLQVEP